MKIGKNFVKNIETLKQNISGENKPQNHYNPSFSSIKEQQFRGQALKSALLRSKFSEAKQPNLKDFKDVPARPPYQNCFPNQETIPAPLTIPQEPINMDDYIEVGEETPVAQNTVYTESGATQGDASGTYETTYASNQPANYGSNEQNVTYNAEDDLSINWDELKGLVGEAREKKLQELLKNHAQKLEMLKKHAQKLELIEKLSDLSIKNKIPHVPNSPNLGKL